MYHLKPIAVVESCFGSKFATPRQSGLVSAARGCLVFNSEIQPELALQGIEGFSHIWIIWWFHHNSNQRYHAKIHPPRLQGQTMGALATRSPHRPNPIGLSLVEVEKFEAPNRLWVRGLDLVDQTPVLDIKPYLVETEAVPLARSLWSNKDFGFEGEIVWPIQVLPDLERWQQYEGAELEVKTLVEQTLRLDPRPLVYKQLNLDTGQLKRNEHAMLIGKADVHFRFLSHNKIEIFKIII